MQDGIVGGLTIDVEDWYQVAAFARQLPPSRWRDCESRVEANVEQLLALLERQGVRATFFVLGSIAQRHPGLVPRIAALGHEIASHGHAHQKVCEQDRRAFREDIRRARALLQDQSGQPVHGYRAPSFSIGDTTPWAHGELADAGHRYSSSVYPVKHDHYGSPEAPRFPWRTPEGLVELPPTTVRLFGRNLPASGGGFFRLLPYRLSRAGLRRFLARESRPPIFYLHPWEIDPRQPRVHDAPLKSRVRHYLNLERTLPRLERLLADFAWDRVDRAFAASLRTNETPS